MIRYRCEISAVLHLQLRFDDFCPVHHEGNGHPKLRSPKQVERYTSCTSKSVAPRKACHHEARCKLLEGFVCNCAKPWTRKSGRAAR